MGNLLANGIAAGSSVYTSTPGCNLSWWWNSPIYTAWRVLWAIASLGWIIIRTIVYTVLMLLQTIVTLVLSYRFLFTWLVILTLTWILWMEFPALITIVRSTWGLVNTGLIYLVFIANMWIRLYSISVLIWNPFYPLLGFFIYILLDLVFSFLIEIIQILGSPAITQLVFLYMSYLHFWPQLFLALLIPVLRFLPSVMIVFVAQAGPIVEVVMNVMPVLFSMVSWIFGKLFFVLEPILSQVVWAVKKVTKLFGRSQNVRKAFTGATFIGRQVLQFFAPEQAIGLDTLHGGATTAATIAQDIQFAAGDLRQVDEAMLAVMMGNATLLSSSTNAFSMNAMGLSNGGSGFGQQQAEKEGRGVGGGTTTTTTTTTAIGATTFTDEHTKRAFSVPAHAEPNYNDKLDDTHKIEDEAIWQEVGATGMKAGWQNAMAVDAAKRELASVRSFLVRHPIESYDELAMRTNTYMTALKQSGGGGGGDGGSSVNSAQSIAVAESMAYSGKQHHSRDLFGYAEVNNVGQWFDDFLYLSHDDDDGGDAGSSFTHSMMSEEELDQAMQQFEQVHNSRRDHGEDNDDEADAATAAAAAAPPTAKHHLYVHKLMALGTPPHLLPHGRLDTVAIDRAHQLLVNRTRAAHPHRMRAAIEQDVAIGRSVVCESRLCGGHGTRMTHPAIGMRQRHHRYKDVRTDDQRQLEDEMDTERLKNRVLMADAVQHATNAAAHRYGTHHMPRAQAALEHHGPVILASVFGHESMTALLEHLAFNYSSWAHLHHDLHERFFANSELFDLMTRHDPNTDTRPFYKDYMRQQKLHFVMERDERHGQMVPNIYIEQQEWIPPSERLVRDNNGRHVTVIHTRGQATGRTLLYTLPLLDFLSKLDCYTTKPRAPLCLPDVFPDNWQLSLSWLPVAFPFPDDINPRCFCAQFFCEQPRLYSKIFPGISKGKWLPNWQYFFGPCRYWNGIVFVLLVLQYVLPLLFLSIAALIAKYRWLRPLLSWVFILPAGEVPSIRVALCMFSHIYDVFLWLFTLWLGGGVVLSRLWPVINNVYVSIVVWLATMRQREEDVRMRRGETLEADLYNTAYDSSLNTGKRDYNDPSRNTLNSLGVPQRYYDSMVPGGRDQLYDTTQQMSNVDRMQYYGVGSGRAPHFVPPYGNPAYRTRYEAAAEAPDLQRDNNDQYYRPGADEMNMATQPMYASLNSFVIGADNDDDDTAAAAAANHHQYQHQQHYIGHEPMFFGSPGDDDAANIVYDTGDLAGASAVPNNEAVAAVAAAAERDVVEREAEALRDLQTVDALQASLTRNLLFFGQPWLPLHSPTYNVWHTVMGWLLDSHHFSEHWQRQMINVWQRQARERLDYMPVRGPVLPARRRHSGGGNGRSPSQ